MRDSFDLVVIGTGFASAFFLWEYLKNAPSSARVLVLEKGARRVPGGPIDLKPSAKMGFQDQWVNETPQKPWVGRFGFGGGTCWTGNTPRMHPSDFRTRTLYGRGEDWPMSYDDLEPDYVAVEQMMGIAGLGSRTFPRSRPYPLPPHRLNALDEAFAKKFPDQHLPMPSARASVAGHGRPPCCGNGVCSTCPIGAKFQVDLHMAQTFEDPRVTLLLDAPADRLEITGNTVQGVHYQSQGQPQFAKCELVAVGAHAIMTPFILLKSGLEDEALGRYLNEQIGIDVSVMLRGLQNYGGSQAVSGFGIMFMDGEFRRERAGCLLENWNIPWLRAEAGRWRERGYFKLVFEDLPQADNRVRFDPAAPERPVVRYSHHSQYMKAGFAAVPKLLETLFDGLPIESFEVHELEGLSTDAHIQGTVRMGTDPKKTVVDGTLRHHRVRNLFALGSAVFPTCPAANPTLTLSALSVRAARSVFS